MISTSPIAGRNGRRSGAAIAALIGMIGLIATAPAPAAVTIGSDLSAAASSIHSGCSNPGSTCTWVQTTRPNLTSPIDGVVVRFRIRKFDTNSIGTVSLRVLRMGATVGSFTGAGTGPPQSTAGTPIISEFPARLPIRAGDQVGLNAGLVPRRTVTGATLKVIEPALADGATAVPNLTGNNTELLMNADIEPDTDGDGFGDETQDGCATDPSTQGACPAASAPAAASDAAAPNTTITSQPKAKTRKKAAAFEFISSEAGSSFECSLNGAPFAGCAPPITVKGKKGKNSFEVRAEDPAGNVDPTPARFEWKVKKKPKS